MWFSAYKSKIFINMIIFLEKLVIVMIYVMSHYFTMNKEVPHKLLNGQWHKTIWDVEQSRFHHNQIISTFRFTLNYTTGPWTTHFNPSGAESEIFHSECQYHGCWCPGSLHHHVISNHGTVETLYSTIYYSKYFIELNFDKSTQYVALWTHKRHPIPRPFGRAMECLLWVLQQKLTVL